MLVSYVVADTDADPKRLRAFAAEFLPRQLLPAAIVSLDRLPLTPTGKLDDSALPTPDFTDSAGYRAPNTPAEQAVAEIFADVLGISSPIGADDDYFDLGGNSLSAVRVIAALRERLDATVTLAVMLTDPTPAGIAAGLTQTDGDETGLDVLLPIRPRGTRIPVFFVHPIVGLSWCYGGLARYLDDDRPMYGLQTPGVCELEEPPSSLSGLAARYLREIRRVAPEGPYHLVGWSLGGVIAHDLAVQLQRGGQHVASLTLLDSFAAQPVPDAGAEEMQAVDLLAGLGITGPFDLVHGSLQSSTLGDLLVEVEGLLPTVSAEHIRRLIAAAEHNARLLRAHTPGVFDGPALLFSATRDDQGSAAAETWSGHVRSITEHAVDTTHWQICAPDALAVIGPALAEHLRTSETPIAASEPETDDDALPG